LLQEVVARLDDNVIFVAEDASDFPTHPFLDQVDVDLLNVDFLVKFGRESRGPEELLVHGERHGGSGTQLLG
jgi:hypothetical protein